MSTTALLENSKKHFQKCVPVSPKHTYVLLEET
jgi:hypothetical protein